MKTTKTTKLRRAGAILAITGGITSTICGGAMWIPYVITWVGWSFFAPLLGFISFIVGMLIILGGILTIRGRSIVGGNLIALLCGFANLYVGGAVATWEVASRLTGSSGWAEWIAGLTLAVVFPVLGGVLGLMSRGMQNEANQ